MSFAIFGNIESLVVICFLLLITEINYCYECVLNQMRTK